MKLGSKPDQFETDGDVISEKGGRSSGDVQAQYIYKNTYVDFKVDTESNISAILTAADIVPSTKTIATLKYPNYESGKLEVHFHPHCRCWSEPTWVQDDFQVN